MSTTTSPALQRSAAEVLRAVVPQARAHFAGQYVPAWVTLMEAQVAQQEEAERRAIAADLANSVNKFAYTDRIAVELELDRPRTAAGCHL